jgi:protein TonB
LVLWGFNFKTEQKPHSISGAFIVVPDDDYYVPPRTYIEKQPDLTVLKQAVNFTLVDDQTEIDEPVDFFDSEYKKGEDFNNLPIWQRVREESEIEPEPVYWAEEMPEFPGGDLALTNYLRKTVHYPEIALSNYIEGKVYVSFVVDTDGSVTDIRIIRGVDPSLDNEAIRVLGSMPKWKPGRQAGRAVKVNYTLPVNFVLNK